MPDHRCRRGRDAHTGLIQRLPPRGLDRVLTRVHLPARQRPLPGVTAAHHQQTPVAAADRCREHGSVGGFILAPAAAGPARAPGTAARVQRAARVVDVELDPRVGDPLGQVRQRGRVDRRFRPPGRDPPGQARARLKRRRVTSTGRYAGHGRDHDRRCVGTGTTACPG